MIGDRASQGTGAGAPGDPSTGGKNRPHVLRSAAALGLCTGLSRLLGFVREVLMAYCFGTSLLKSAFDVAFRVPNMLRSLFGEGALSAAFVPTLTETLTREGPDETRRLAGRVAALLAAVLAAILLVGFVAVSVAILFVEPGGKADTVLSLLRILLPYLFFICLVAMLSAVLNVHHRFVLPAMGPVLLNVVWVFALVWVWFAFRDRPEAAIRVVCWAIVAAGAAQLAMLWFAATRVGGRMPLAIDWRDSRVRRMLVLMGPAALGIAVYQANIMISGILALLVGPWAPAALSYAERLVYLPLGLFATALGTVLLPAFSRHAAEDRIADIRETLVSSLRTLMLVLLPAATLMAVLATPIVEAIFSWKGGRFHGDSVTYTARALACYAPGLVVFSTVKLLAPAFYAVQDMRTPVKAACVAMLVNLALNLVAVFTWPEGFEHAGMALATVFASLVNTLMLATALGRRIGVGGGRQAFGAVARMCVAAAIMGWVACVVHSATFTAALMAGHVDKTAQGEALVAALAVSIVAYGVVVRIICPADVRRVFSGIGGRRLQRKGQATQ